MFFYVYILLITTGTFVFAQRGDTTAVDSVGTYIASPITVKGAFEIGPVEPLVLRADLRYTERIAATSSLSRVLPLIHSSLDIRSYGTLGGISLPLFRGLPSEYISIYRNGIRLTNAQNSLTDLERYTSRATSNVSILSSTESAMYSTGVAGAAVILESQQPRENFYTGSVGALVYSDVEALNEKEYFLQGAETLGDLGIKVSGNYKVSDGAFPFRQKEKVLYRENNDAYLGIFEAETHFVLGQESHLTGLLTFSEAERGVPGANTIDGAGASTPKTRQFDKDWLGGMFYRAMLSGRYSHEASASYQSQFETYRDLTRAIDDKYTNTIFASTYKVRFIASEEVLVLATLEYTNNLLTSSQHRATGDIERQQYSSLLTARYSATEELALTVSAHAEKISDISQVQVNPSLRADYRFPNGLNLSGAFSRFFHPPTFNQLYWSVGGNPLLKPERGESLEFRASFRSVIDESLPIKFQAAAFRTEIREQIVWTPGRGGIWSPINVQRVRTTGLEVETSMSVSLDEVNQLGFRLAFTYADVANLTDSSEYHGNELPYSTPLRLLAFASYERKELGSVAAILTHRSRRYTDFANNPDGQLPATLTIDIHLQTAPVDLAGIALIPKLSIVNISNTRYEDIINYPLPGRMFKLDFTFTYHPE